MAQKSLPSKYFYDDAGSRIFQEIMDLPAYYLTNCELEIFTTQGQEIIKDFTKQAHRIRIIDLGAGDGTKTKLLIQACYAAGISVLYTPIDISGEAIRSVEKSMLQSFPELEIDPIEADYFKALDEIEQSHEDVPKLLLFLGSNIGNYSLEEGSDFIRTLSQACHRHDGLLIGFDLQKNPRLILEAYDDKEGVTARFNLNLLTRINRELGGEFQLENFEHYECYNPLNGLASSFLISQNDQAVFIAALEKDFHFKAGEPIAVEISKKYTIAEIEVYGAASGFTAIKHYLDHKQYFSDTLFYHY